MIKLYIYRIGLTLALCMLIVVSVKATAAQIPLREKVCIPKSIMAPGVFQTVAGYKCLPIDYLYEAGSAIIYISSISSGSTLNIKNLGSGIAQITITFYNLDDSINAFVPDAIPVNAIKVYIVDQFTSPGYDGYAYISSDQQISAYVEYSISGHILDNTNQPIFNVTIADTENHSTTTDANGFYILSGLSSGEYTLIPSKSGMTFTPQSRTNTIPPNAISQDFMGKWKYEIYLPIEQR